MRSHPERAFIVCLLLFAAMLRLVGSTHGQPDPRYMPTDTARRMIHENVAIHPDEYFFVSIPLRMVVLDQYNPKFFENPSFLINLSVITNILTGVDAGRDYETWRGISERRHASFDLYFIGRIYSALGGLVAVAAVYATARRLSGRWGAVAAGLLAAVSLPLVQHAHYATTSSLAAGFAALAVWAAVEAFAGAHKARSIYFLFILSGVAAGVAAGNRYNAAGVAIVVAGIGVMFWVRLGLRRPLWWVVFGGLAIPIAFILSTPHTLFDTAKFIEDFLFISRRYIDGENMAFTSDYGLYYEFRYLIVYGLGLPAAALIVVGVLRGLFPDAQRQNVRPIMVVMLLYMIAYALVVMRTRRPLYSDQLLVPVIPAYAVLLGIGFGALAQRLRRSWWCVGLLVGGIALPLTPTLQVMRVLDQTDTRYLMQDWIETHIPHGAHLHLFGPYNVPLDEAHYTWTQNYYGQFLTLDDALAGGAEYVILSDAWALDPRRALDIMRVAEVATYETYEASWRERLTPIATIGRPALIGMDDPLHTASLFHQPGLTLFCVPGRSCDEIARPVAP